MMGPVIAAVMAAGIVHVMSFAALVPEGRGAARAASAAAGESSALSQVTGVSVRPSAAGAEVVVLVGAGSRLRHFSLDGPSRLVIDIANASVSAGRLSYDGLERGPVKNVRIAQFRPDTVRIVVDLAARHKYNVTRDGGEIRLTIAAPATSFAAWEAGAGAAFATQAINTDIESAAVPVQSVDVAPPARDQAVVPVEQMTVVTSAPVAARQTAARPQDVQGAAGRLADAPVNFSSQNGTPAPSARRQQQPQKPRISVTFDGTDIRDVIATFATFSGRTIVVGKNVSGNVTAEINDKPWDLAFQAILQAQGLAATEDASGIITVDTYQALASNQALEPLVTQVLEVNYAKATALRQTVQSLLARDCTGMSTMATGRELGMPMQGGAAGQQGISGQGCVVRGSVTADSATNKLIITEVPSRIPEIVARIQELDIRTQQVAIKAKIIFVNRTGIQDIGLAYDLGTGNRQFFQQLVPRIDPATRLPIDTDGDGVPDALGGGTPFEGPARIALGGNAIAGIANANNAIKPNALNLIYSTALGRYQLTAFLNALQTSSLADVQSEPSVTILNNRTATIFVGQEIPIRVIDASAGGQGGGQAGGGGGGGQQPNAATFFPRATVSKEEAGIKLTVTPQITNNRMVLLQIHAENSSAELANTDVGVVFNRQRAESQVLVADGEAAVIGGLTVTERTKFRSGIPILMNLPFIGRLFSQNTTSETKRDLLILVTPHILEDVTPARDR
jgi:type IV pilus assembly protein PilQ